VAWLGEGSFEPCAEMAAFKAARPSQKIATGAGISLAQIERLTILSPISVGYFGPMLAGKPNRRW
jgi:hypothetical protein